MSSSEEVKHLQIPLQELSDATNGFSEQNLIARGGFGKVYKGVSIKHANIAIKMLDPRLGQGDHEFRTEIALLSVYKHENIVSLLGFCDEDGQKILVYKYESNGSLDKHLRSSDLTWIQRLQICLDAARGLQYLHDDVGHAHRILHRDVKSSNILLDENWKAKIADFGLSRIGPANMQSTFLISNACGTIGYIDPEYLNTGYLTQKSDVYSFGVVLFEVICGRLTRVTSYNDERQFLTVLININYKRQTLDKIIHPNLYRQINKASLLTFTTIAYQCLMSGNERPTMKKVVDQLQKALDDQLVSGSKSVDDAFAAHLRGQSRLLQASSSQSRVASSFESLKYDVYISFIGEDTRKTFVDLLDVALARRHIVTYKFDKTFPRKKSVDSLLLKSIQESRIAIIVFSQYYANSSWCLNELEIIMKNKDERGQIVMPVFYGVKPFEVRKQTGNYEKALARHASVNNNKVDSWRKALVRASYLRGLAYDPAEVAKRHDVKYIKKLVDKISYELLSMQRTEAGADTHLIGIDTRKQELKSLLEVGSGGIHMVGICGMWGSGKSTLASSIYDEIAHEFEGCCFVTNVRAESKMHGLKTLQEKILSDVLKSKVTLESIEQGTFAMTNRMCVTSVLIVLDDVDDIDQLEMLAGSKNWFGDGSRIIFTTRNQDLVNAHNGITHNVRMLDDTESIELFSRHAFGETKPVQGFEEVSLIMVSKCCGHPSALISLGSFLRGKEMSVWMSILDKLEGITVDEILTRFKIRDD